MKYILLLLLSCLTVGGCSSSDNNRIDSRELSDIVTLNPPANQSADSAVIYIDSATIVNHNNGLALLISGDFPDGCTQLKRVEHKWPDEQLSLTLSAWRDPDLSCTQALTPFSFIYEQLSEQELKKLDTIRINETSYSLQ